MTGESATQLWLASAALAAMSGWLLMPGGRSAAKGARSRRHWWLRGLLLAAGTALAWHGFDLVTVVDLLVAGAVAAATIRLLQRTRVAGEASRRRASLVLAVDALVAELRSGRPPQLALEQVAGEWPEVAPAAASARLGGDVPSALRALSGRPGAEALREVAAAWQVSMRSGAGLAEVLDRLGAALREQEEVSRETAAAVAPARATAQLLAVLPVVGLGLGAALGGDPLRVLFGTPLGSVLLVLGTILALAGVLWVERLVAAVEA